MSVKLGEAFVYLFGENKGLEDDLGDAEKKTTSWAQGLSGKVGNLLGTVVKVGAAGAAAAIVGIGAAAFSAGMQMDEAMDTIAISTGATGEALEGLGDDFKAVFTSIPTDAGAASGVIGELNARLGLTGPELQGVSKNVLEMSRLLGGDASTNAALLARVMGDWGIANEDAAGTLDKLFVAGQQTGASVEGLMQKVVQFGSPLRLMGFTLEESVALFAKWEKEGVNAELVMGSLRIAAGKFAQEGVPLQEGLQGTIDKIQGMEDASAALALGMEIFGARAGPDMVAAIREGRFAADDLIAAMEGAEGAILGTADATADFPEKMQEFKNVATTVLAPLGAALMGIATDLLTILGPAVLQVAAWAGPAFESMGLAASMLFDVLRGTGGDIPWDDILPPGLAAIAFGISDAFAGLVGAATSLFSGLSSGSGQVTGISSALAGMAPPVSGLGAAFQTVAGIVTGVVSQIGPILYNIFVTQMQTALSVATTVWGTIGSIISTVVPTIITLLGMIGERAVPVLVTAFQLIEKIVSDVAAFVVPLVQEMATFIQEQFAKVVAWVDENMPLIQATMDTVFNAIKIGLGVLLQVWNTVWPVMQVVVMTVWDVIKVAVETAVNVILGIIKTLMQLITGDFAGAWETMKGVITTALSGVLTIVQTVLEDVGNALTGKVGDFITAGADLVAGLVKGIQDNAGKVLDTMLNMVKSGVDAVKNFFGIKSPSKVMIQIGENLTGGLAIGIEAGGVEATAAMQKVVSSIAKAFKDLASAFHQMNKVQKVEGGLPDLELWARAMKEAIVRFATAVSEATKEVSDRVLRKAQEFAGKIKELFELLRTLGSVLSDLNAIKTIPDLGPFGAALRQAIVTASSAILEAAAQLGDKALKSAGKLSEDAQKVIGLIGPAVGALGAVAEMKEVTSLDTKMAQLNGAIQIFLDAINALAIKWANTALDSAATFAESAQKVVGLIGPAVQALAGFVEFPAVGNLHEKVSFLSEALQLFLDYLNALAIRWANTGLDSAVKFSEAAAKIVGLVKPAVDALAAMAEYKPVEGLPGMMGQFQQDLYNVVNAMRLVALAFETEMMKAASETAQAMMAVVGLVKPGIDALVALATYTPLAHLPGIMIRFRQDLFNVVDAMRSVALAFGAEGMKAAAESAQYMTQVVALVKPGIDAIAAIGEYETVKKLPGILEVFKMDLFHVIEAIRSVALAFETEATAAAAGIASSVTTILGMVKPAIDTIEALAKYTAAKGLTAAMAKFETDLKAVVLKLGSIAVSLAGDDGIGKANAFGEAATAIKKAIETGLGTLSSLSGGGASSAAAALAAFAKAAQQGMKDAVTAIKDGAKNIIAALKPLPGDIAAIFASYNWASIGKGIAEGIAKGISGGASAIKTAAKQAAHAALTSAKAELGIASPSERMRKEVGMQAGMGMVLGVEDMIPKIRAAMEQLTGQFSLGGLQPAVAGVTESLSVAYNDYRSGGGAPDIVDVAEQLEWLRKMRR